MGEALKMIMTSAGYAEQAPTDSHWASGYLAKPCLLVSPVTIFKLYSAITEGAEAWLAGISTKGELVTMVVGCFIARMAISAMV